jgi:predicted nucleic acid-binding protein
MILYADSSALGSVYLGDEADAPWLHELILHGPDPVVTSELADVEVASLLRRACSDGRIDAAALSVRLSAYEADTSDAGPLGVLPVSHETFAAARKFVLQTDIRSLDALHLASARDLTESAADVAVLTRDRRQAAAARALGFRLHPRSV